MALKRSKNKSVQRKKRRIITRHSYKTSQRKRDSGPMKRSFSRAGPSGVRRSRKSRTPQDFRLDLNRMKPPQHMNDINLISYIRKLKNRVSPSVKQLSTESLNVMDCWIKGTLHHIGSMAASQMGRRKVLKPKVILRAMRKIFPKNIRQKADERGQRALAKYKKNVKH